MGWHWKTIAKADSSEGLQNTVPSVSEIDSGTIGRVTVEGLGAASHVFDLAWAEQTIGQWLAPDHARIIDVYEENHIGYINFEVTGTPAHIIIAGVAVALIAIGVIAAVITVAIQVPDALDPENWENLIKWGGIGLIALAAVYYLKR